jgi:aminobenzoyl-glutamate transport protein
MRPRSARVLDAIERAGNRLPNPITLFLLLAVAVLLASWLCAKLGITAIHPRDGSTILAVNLLDGPGVRRLYTDAVKNFMGFAPLGFVLVAMIGVGVAEATGLLSVVLRAFVIAIPRRFLTLAIVFAGVNADLAADAGVVILPPIAAMLFASVGRHPLAGIAAAFAGTAGAFSSNLVPTMIDVLLASFTQEAVTASRILDDYQVQTLGNYFFLFLSVPLLTAVGAVVTDRVIEPRLGKYAGSSAEELGPLEPKEKRGLVAAGVGLVLTIVLFVWLTRTGAPLRVEGATLLLELKPVFDSLVVWVLLFFLIPGLLYGITVGNIHNDHDVARMASESLATMASYIVLAFTASQFIAYFGWSNLGAIIAIGGANVLRGLDVGGTGLILAFVAFTAVINLLMCSASALWLVLAPVFVPMFVLLGFSPEGTQAIFRIGDSATNIATPLFPYLPIIIGYAKKYDSKAGTGTIIALMIPYALSFLAFWTVLFLVFYWFDLPIGPGVQITIPR